MHKHIEQLLLEYVQHMQATYGTRLYRVVLFGSYARGTQRRDSDIDIMVLFAVSQKDIGCLKKEVNGYTYDFNMEHNIDIEPVTISYEHFQYWKEAPFYQAILAEGVLLYDAAA